jgi:ABC-2 type transport system permease protein
MILTLVGMIVTPAISGTAVLRDFELKTHELLFTTRLSKPSFVLGRFLGAYLVTVLVLLLQRARHRRRHAVAVDRPEKLGPGGLANYLWPIVVYVLPNALIACALFFAVGILTRSFVAVAIQGVVLFVGYRPPSRCSPTSRTRPSPPSSTPSASTPPAPSRRAGPSSRRTALLVPVQGLAAVEPPAVVGFAVLVLGLAYRLFRMEAFLGGAAAASPRPVAASAPGAQRPRPPASVTLRLRRPRRAARPHRPLLPRHHQRPALPRPRRRRHDLHASPSPSTPTPSTAPPPTRSPTRWSTSSAASASSSSSSPPSTAASWCGATAACAPTRSTTPPRSPAPASSPPRSSASCSPTPSCCSRSSPSASPPGHQGLHELRARRLLRLPVRLTFPASLLTTLLAFFLQVLVNNKYVGIGLVVCSYIFLIAMGAWGLDHRLYGFGNPPTSPTRR